MCVLTNTGTCTFWNFVLLVLWTQNWSNLCKGLGVWQGGPFVPHVLWGRPRTQLPTWVSIRLSMSNHILFRTVHVLFRQFFEDLCAFIHIIYEVIFIFLYCRTENTAMIAGLGQASKLVTENIDKYNKHMQKIRDYLEERLKVRI